jgi:hypothetical protein
MKQLERISLLIVAAFTLCMLNAAPASALPQPYVGGQFRYWVFSNHNDMRDVLAYWVPGPFHVQLEYWDFLDPGSPDQFRPEVGVHLRDHRNSVYTAQWRHEHKAERLTFSTEQILNGNWVGRAEVSPIITKDDTKTVVSAGFDYYWKSYNFASATLIHDPREDNLWVVPVRVRLATESYDWIQATVAPASKGSIGWAFDVRVRGVRLGVEHNNKYDFTNLDNTIYTVGFERAYGPKP